MFQCSSASRKFLNRRGTLSRWGATRRFSALQRAENSSINSRAPSGAGRLRFQCSSASRKFLNPTAQTGIRRYVSGFQCSSASRKFLNTTTSSSLSERPRVSVLFSEPKIPQCRLRVVRSRPARRFSALQRAENSSMGVFGDGDAVDVESFSALQRAENSSISLMRRAEVFPPRFQCSSASRKFLNTVASFSHRDQCIVSVLFSEPKIPQLQQRRKRIRQRR